MNFGDFYRFCKYRGALEGIRIPDLLNRNQMLYPAELRAHFKRNVKYSQRFLKSFINFDIFVKNSFFTYPTTSKFAVRPSNFKFMY